MTSSKLFPFSSGGSTRLVPSISLFFCLRVSVRADKPMQLNQAFFLLGGGSGYIPQPEVMRDDVFDPFDKDTLNLEPITVQLQVIPDRRQENLPELG